MKITADTNVLISSTFWHGASDKVIEKVENKEVELFLSEATIEEFMGVINDKEIQSKISDKNLEMKRSVQKIISISNMVIPNEKVDIVKDDPDDNKIIECALEGKADFILTYDKHLLKLKTPRNIKIITPEEFLKLDF